MGAGQRRGEAHRARGVRQLDGHARVQRRWPRPRRGRRPCPGGGPGGLRTPRGGRRPCPRTRRPWSAGRTTRRGAWCAAAPATSRLGRDLLGAGAARGLPGHELGALQVRPVDGVAEVVPEVGLGGADRQQLAVGARRRSCSRAGCRRRCRRPRRGSGPPPKKAMNDGTAARAARWWRRGRRRRPTGPCRCAPGRTGRTSRRAPRAWRRRRSRPRG